MAKKRKTTKKKKTTTSSLDLDFSFYSQLLFYYQQNKNKIRPKYTRVSKQFLDYNDPKRPGSFLRTPQFEALEIYIFLKEYSNNAYVHELFNDWYNREGIFEGRGSSIEKEGQLRLDEELTGAAYKKILSSMKAGRRLYPNYIFALTMGTGKTLLMATCIYYEFLLANKYPKDERFCQNALIFAPDKTVLDSLREIETFDVSKVVPSEYQNFISSHVNFHFLDDAGTTLSALDDSKFNLVVSNTQKIILKRKHKEKGAVQKLFSTGQQTLKIESVYDELSDLYISDTPEEEGELVTNQRFEKLKRLPRLGVYVDEAHHAFGDSLAKDLGYKKSKTSLRITIDELAAMLGKNNSKLVGCYNFTGTPYVGKVVLPEVVYAYGLREAIDNQYLKKIRIRDFTNVKTEEFVRIVIDEFKKMYDGKRFEGMLPKLAFFGTDIEEVQNKLKPVVEKVVVSKGFKASSVLVNVGDPKITSSDDIREFRKLDSEESEKQFILLVNKGREGWNCRSLFGVALYRKPRSKIFVLQASMRCLRAIGPTQPTGSVFLSSENYKILDDELNKNFRISASDVQDRASDKVDVKIRPVPPPITIKLKRVLHSYNVRQRDLNEIQVALALNTVDVEKYKIRSRTIEGLDPDKSDSGKVVSEEDLTSYREKFEYSEITLVSEIAKYLNKSPLFIEELLEKTDEGIEGILSAVNEFNQILYDVIIPSLTSALYELTSDEKTEEYEVSLIKNVPPDPGYYQMTASKDMVSSISEVKSEELKDKSFHVDNYCFDSWPEKNLFWALLESKKVEKVWFTGMFTHGQSEFFIQYIDPESNSLRSYYPDFVFVDKEGRYNVVEVKGDNMIDDPTVMAKKEFAEQMAVASGMTYKIIKGSDANESDIDQLFE